MTSTPYSMHHVPVDDRPRERLLQHGPETMTTAELIAIILGSGMKGIPVLQLAQEIVARFGDTQRLNQATIPELCTIKGLGPAKALQLKAALSLGVRATRSLETSKIQIHTPNDAYRLLKESLELETRELFIVLLQDIKGFVINQTVVAIGTLSNALVHPREVFNPAIRNNAASLILAHNHPSGDPTPSQYDIEVTHTLVEAGETMGIPVNDHLIIGKNCFTSLRVKGHIKKAKQTTTKTFEV